MRMPFFGRELPEADPGALTEWANDLLAPYVGLDALRPVDEATNVHEAVGLWWAHLVLHPIRETADGTVARPELPLDIRAAYEVRIGGFAMELAALSRERGERGGTIIRADYATVNGVLAEAAERAEMPYDPRETFSPKCYTRIDDGEIVLARAGPSAQEVQIWPPVS